MTTFWCWIAITVVFIASMIAWREYYESYLNKPNLETKLNLSLSNNEDISFSRYNDIEIGPYFGDETIGHVVIDDPKTYNILNHQVIGQGWEFIDNGEYGKYYHCEFEIISGETNTF